VLLWGCDLSVPALDHPSRSFDRPLLHLTAITATREYDTHGVAEHVALSEDQQTEGIELSASFRLSFDRFLLPHKVIRQSVCLHPTTAKVDSIEDCSSPYQPFTEPEYNPVLRQVVYRLPEGNRLVADTLYRFTVFAAPTLDDSGLFAFDGAPLARRYAFDLKTKSDISSARDEPLPSAERYCSAQLCFSSCVNSSDSQSCKDSCAKLCLGNECGSLADGNLLGGPPGGALFAACTAGGCHSPATADSDGPAMGLDLSTVVALSQTAVGKTAHQTQGGHGATIPHLSGTLFGRAMAVIEPYNPGNSYLMYKLLVSPHNHGASYDASPSLGPAIERLHAGVVVGLPMPAATSVTAKQPAVSPQLMQLISDWIAHGAVSNCHNSGGP